MAFSGVSALLTGNILTKMLVLVRVAFPSGFQTYFWFRLTNIIDTGWGILLIIVVSVEISVRNYHSGAIRKYLFCFVQLSPRNPRVFLNVLIVPV